LQGEGLLTIFIKNSKMKNLLIIFIAAIVSVLGMAGCQQNSSKEKIANADSSISVSKSEVKSNIADSSKATTSEITCPKCGHKKTETLPTDVCVLSYTCEKCKTVLHPKEGDCCVFCTYGDHKCPSKQ
jgi:DNA-directed RNA polymerase subunit M/transcription elongation factor TFIIS